MSFQYARLTSIQFVPSGSGALYTHVTSSNGGVGGDAIATASYIRSIIIASVDNTNPETVTLWITGSGSTPAPGIAPDSGSQFYQEVLPSLNTRIIEFPTPGLMLTVHGETLIGGTINDSKVTVMIMGGQE